MNKRQVKKAKKKKGAEALLGRNAYLERENVKLRQEMAVALKGLEEVGISFNANLAAIAQVYGEKEDSVMVLRVPISEVTRAIMNYDVKCSIENEQYIICALPKVDPEG